MTEQERKDWQQKFKWLPAENAAQWTQEVREAWLRMRKAHKAWAMTRTPPNPALTSVKEPGDKMPRWIANDAYIAYMIAAEDWRLMEPKYITDNRARLSAGDFEEDENE